MLFSPPPPHTAIVYSARYYTPSGRGVSHWHLYRINPDGTGKQPLTAGTKDDFVPRWSPDGKKIAFLRTSETDTEALSMICMVGAEGGSVKCLVTLKKNEVLTSLLWSPDSHRIAITLSGENDLTQSMLIDLKAGHQRVFAGKSALAWSPEGKRLLLVGEILEVSTEKITRTEPVGNFARWIGNDLLEGLWTDQETGNSFLRTIDLTGTEKVRLPLDPASADLGRIDGLFFIPPAHAVPGLEIDNSNSTVRPLHLYYRWDRKTGKLTQFAEGQFLTFSPDGTHFCTAPGRDLAPYRADKAGKPRAVWVAPLQVGSMPDGKLKTITPEKVWVRGADWQHRMTAR